MSQIRLIVVISVMMSAVFGFSMALHAQIPEVTPEAEMIRSLFSGDTCEPPCWFGLIPGESSSEEVLEFFKSNYGLFSEQWPIKINGEIDPLTGYLVKGSYSFHWVEDVTPSQLVIPHGILINDGIFDQLNVRMNKPITLREMLDILGHPEHLRLTLDGWGGPMIIAIYEAPRIRIVLKSPSSFENCTFSDAATQFLVSGMTYFSPDAAQQPVTRGQDQSPQPQLTAYRPDEYDVADEELQKWLNNDEESKCIEVWEALQAKSQANDIDE